MKRKVNNRIFTINFVPFGPPSHRCTPRKCPADDCEDVMYCFF